MGLKTLENDEKYLRQKSEIVSIDDKDLKNDIKALVEYCNTHDVWAMASIQLGIKKQLIYVVSTNSTCPNGNTSILLINPQVLQKKGRTQFWEACESCMPHIGLVERPYLLKVRYQDIEGVWNIKAFEGFEATVVSHELDHLQGILHMDRATKLKKLDKSGRLELREKEPYKIISKDCEFLYEEEKGE